MEAEKDSLAELRSNVKDEAMALVPSGRLLI
jgi:hypothetical protein